MDRITAKDYRARSVECHELAARVRDAGDKSLWLDLADFWLERAIGIETRGAGDPPSHAPATAIDEGR